MGAVTTNPNPFRRRTKILLHGFIRDLVARSGLSQQDFALRLGTSRPRLSTYMTGKVTPSASLMVRMRRIAARAQGSRAE